MLWIAWMNPQWKNFNKRPQKIILSFHTYAKLNNFPQHCLHRDNCENIFAILLWIMYKKEYNEVCYSNTMLRSVLEAAVSAIRAADGRVLFSIGGQMRLALLCWHSLGQQTSSEIAVLYCSSCASIYTSAKTSSTDTKRLTAYNHNQGSSIIGRFYSRLFYFQSYEDLARKYKLLEASPKIDRKFSE
jgi:hypothetical protein